MTQKHIHDIIWTQQTNVCRKIDCRLIYRQDLGYIGSGEKIRNFDYELFYDDIRKKVLNTDLGETREGYHWKAYDIWSEDIAADSDFRLDYKYWEPKFRKKLNYFFGKNVFL